MWARLPGTCSARFFKELDVFEPGNAKFCSPAQYCSPRLEPCPQLSSTFGLSPDHRNFRKNFRESLAGAKGEGTTWIRGAQLLIEGNSEEIAWAEPGTCGRNPTATQISGEISGNRLSYTLADFQRNFRKFSPEPNSIGPTIVLPYYYFTPEESDGTSIYSSGKCRDMTLHLDLFPLGKCRRECRDIYTVQTPSKCGRGCTASTVHTVPLQT